MGKGKNKGFKLKEYKVPQEKYVVVVNSWGLPERFDNNTKLNEIGVWFELLLRKDYPNARVREIFYQKTHRYIIVELPREVDITRYLGAYPYSQFHNKIPQEDTRTLCIYEYRYATFGNPANKNWTGVIPTNNNIPTGLLQLLKDPFPFPSPAPPPPLDAPYAWPIPREIQNALAAVRLIASTSKSMEMPPPSLPAPNVDSSSFTQPPQVSRSLFTPYEPPSHFVAHLEASKTKINQQEEIHEPPQVKKMDPYEEEEVERALLRSLSPIKKGESNEGVNFNSSLSNVKSEEDSIVFPSTSREDSKTISRTASTFDGEGDYKPSADLLDLFNTLDSKDIIVKSEVVDAKMMPDDEYRPSDELLAAFANLSDVTGCDEQSIRQEQQDLRVKEKPTDIQLPGRNPSLSEPKQLPRPSTSRTTMETPRQMALNSNVQVKPEPVDDAKMFCSPNRHYPISRDPEHPTLPPPARGGNFQPSRDPRKRPMHSVLPVKHERTLEVEAEDEDEGSVLFRKRLKMER